MNIPTSGFTPGTSRPAWQPETGDTLESEIGAGDLSSRQRKWSPVTPTSGVMMCHYACRLLGNEPPTLKMKWARRRPVCRVWSEVVLSHECHFIPAAASVKPFAQRVARCGDGPEAERCVSALITAGGTQT